MKILILIFALGTLNFVKAGLLQFRPLTAKQVYDMLRAARREDAVPEGRVITQGIAAMSGFAAGIATGIGVPLIFNIDLANVTGITAMLNGGNSGGQTQTQTQEICFNSKAANEVENIESARNFQPYMNQRYLRVREGRARRDSFEEKDDDVEGENENENEDEDMQNSQLPTTTNAENPDSHYDDDDNDENNRNYNGIPTSTDNTEKLIQISPTTTAATTGATSPGNTNTNTNTNTGTTADTGTGSGTRTETTTQTGGNGAVNCIVIQKPTSG